MHCRDFIFGHIEVEVDEEKFGQNYLRSTKYMQALLVLLSAIFISGCATNRIHFAPYTQTSEINKIERSIIDIDIIKVSGISPCIECRESEKIVWHAGNHGAFLYEGFFKIPIDDWESFIKNSLGSNPNSRSKVELEIKRVILKTWHNPNYYACESEILITLNGQAYEGRSLVKTHGTGQDLVGMDRVKLNSHALEIVRLSLKQAYINAFQNE